MSDSKETQNQAVPDGPMSPEELEAAQAANEADALAQAQAELATLKAKSSELADQFLRAKAEAENARRRAEEEIAKARKFGIESFAASLLPVCDRLEAGLAIQAAVDGAHATGTNRCLELIATGGR